jgi:hypothetical protein
MSENLKAMEKKYIFYFKFIPAEKKYWKENNHLRLLLNAGYDTQLLTFWYKFHLITYILAF